MANEKIERPEEWSETLEHAADAVAAWLESYSGDSAIARNFPAVHRRMEHYARRLRWAVRDETGA